MADDKGQTAADRQRLGIRQGGGRRDRARSLGTAQDELRRAAQTVGRSADGVRDDHPRSH
ncbi:MAG: hypothetical protein QM777_16395 [Pseudorhodoferax sp.]